MYTRSVLVAALLMAASLGLGGCFHHGQTYMAEPLPPPPLGHPPLK
jgi:hypothetical protein